LHWKGLRKALTAQKYFILAVAWGLFGSARPLLSDATEKWGCSSVAPSSCLFPSSRKAATTNIHALRNLFFDRANPSHNRFQRFQHISISMSRTCRECFRCFNLAQALNQYLNSGTHSIACRPCKSKFRCKDDLQKHLRTASKALLIVAVSSNTSTPSHTCTNVTFVAKNFEVLPHSVSISSHLHSYSNAQDVIGLFEMTMLCSNTCILGCTPIRAGILRDFLGVLRQ
jgi:hypothetical protein